MRISTETTTQKGARGPRDAPGVTREKVRALIEEGHGNNEIARRLSVSRPTVTYHAKRLGMAPILPKRTYDWPAIQAHYDQGHSVRKCRERFGFSGSAWTDAVRRGAVVPRPMATPLPDLLVKNHRRSRWNLKRRLVVAGIKEPRCEECGLEEWQGKPLNLALHHRNGDGHDNRLENLHLLCPNCHSQTDNFGCYNRKRRTPNGAPRDWRGDPPTPPSRP